MGYNDVCRVRWIFTIVDIVEENHKHWDFDFRFMMYMYHTIKWYALCQNSPISLFRPWTYTIFALVYEHVRLSMCTVILSSLLPKMDNCYSSLREVIIIKHIFCKQFFCIHVYILINSMVSSCAWTLFLKFRSPTLEH